MTPAEIVQIIIGFLTLIVTAFVPVMIYWLQKRHEKEMDEVRKVQIAKELENKANEFLIDHENERDYLPWCTIASGLHRHEHHTRKIYTDFCRCPLDLQLEILKQAGFTLELVPNNGWVDSCIERIQDFINANELGDDWLYDNGKYFHRSFERYREKEWEESPRIFEPIDKDNIARKIFQIDYIDIGTYIDEYLWYRSHPTNETKMDMTPPIDCVATRQDFWAGDECEICKWMLDIVFYITVYIHNTTLFTAEDVLRDNATDASPETFEDRYYDALLYMYYTFIRIKPMPLDEE